MSWLGVHSVHPVRVRGEFEFWNFGFLGEVKVFLISGGVIFRRGRSVIILRPCSHLKCKI